MTAPENPAPEPQEDHTSPSPRTERSIARSQEDRSFMPVIVKRTDDTKRHPDDILENAIREGSEQLYRPVASLILSSVAAGLILGFTAMAVGVAYTATADMDNAMLQRIIVAAFYPLGFVICIMSGTQLFTEHTATAVYPVLDRRAHYRLLIRLWLLVILGNLLGATISATLLGLGEDVIGASVGYDKIAAHALAFPNHTLFLSAILAGWLMAQGAWLVLATPPTMVQVICIYLVTFLIGIGGLHHSIAGAVEMMVAYILHPKYTLGEVGRFIAIALAGNLVGGSMFVGLLNYGHIRKSQQV